MRKSKLLLLAALAMLSFSAVVHADQYDMVQVKTWDVSVVHDLVMPSLKAADFVAPAATTATYAMQSDTPWVDTPRVFRDFRTIADSGGRRV